jgi:methionyl-tRNA synthetase
VLPHVTHNDENNAPTFIGFDTIKFHSIYCAKVAFFLAAKRSRVGLSLGFCGWDATLGKRFFRYGLGSAIK